MTGVAAHCRRMLYDQNSVISSHTFHQNGPEFLIHVKHHEQRLAPLSSMYSHFIKHPVLNLVNMSAKKYEHTTLHYDRARLIKIHYLWQLLGS